MDSLRKWLNKPKADDKSLLARFYHADRALTAIASELDSFDGRAEPVRCTRLVGRLRQGQDRVLAITNQIMDELLGDDRAPRAFRVKFPEEVLQESLAGQLWFGAECLAAGSSILNREFESAKMRPLAKAVTNSLEIVRNRLREQCLRNNTPNSPVLRLDLNDAASEQLYESLKIFDRLFAQFELVYVSAMVQVKTKQEYEMQELICVLFSETLQRALKIGLLEQEQVDSYDPALMFSIPRLAIIAGLAIFADGPLNMDQPADNISEMFRPFRKLLIKMRDLLHTLTKHELYQLEKLLCTNEEINLSEQMICDEDEREGTGSGGGGGPNGGGSSSDGAVAKSVGGASGVDRVRGMDDEHEPLGESKEHVMIVTTSRTNTAGDVDEDEYEDRTNVGNVLAISHHIAESDNLTFKYGDINVDEGSSGSSGNSGNNSKNRQSRNQQRRLQQHSSRNKDNDDVENDDGIVTTALATLAADNNQMNDDNDYDDDDDDDDNDDNDDDDDDDDDDNQHEDVVGGLMHNVLVTPDCTSGYLIPNTNFGNLLQTNEAPLTDSFIATDDEVRLLSDDHLEGANESNMEQILAGSQKLQESDSGHVTATHSTDMSPELESERTVLLTAAARGVAIDGEVLGASNISLKTVRRSAINSSLRKKQLSTSQKQSEMIESSDDDEHDIGYGGTDVDVDDDEEDGNKDKRVEDEQPDNRNHSATDSQCPSGSQAKHSQSTKHHRRQSHHHRPRSATTGSLHRKTPSYRQHYHRFAPAGTSTSTTLSVATESGDGSRQQVATSSSSSCDTSPTQSECSDAQEVALAIRAAGRNKFKTTENLLHRLFVCIAGVADQLQTNFAADLRKMLKSVFIMNSSPPEPEEPPPAANLGEAEAKDSQHPSDMFEFRASEQDVITADQNNSGGSSQSIYSAEEANPEQDSVFVSSGDSSPVRRTTSVESGNVTVNVSVSVVTSSPGNGGSNGGTHVMSGEGGTRSAQERSVSLSEACIVVEGGKASLRRYSSGGSKSDYARSKSSPNSPINSNSNGSSNRSSVSNTPSTARGLQREQPHQHEQQSQQQQVQVPPRRMPEEPPRWIPDCDAPRCMACASAFTPFRRRHHCRNCGGVFCGVCSNLSAPLPKYGLTKAVRVCRDCFVREVGV